MLIFFFTTVKTIGGILIFSSKFPANLEGRKKKTTSHLLFFFYDRQDLWGILILLPHIPAEMLHTMLYLIIFFFEITIFVHDGAASFPLGVILVHNNSIIPSENDVAPCCTLPNFFSVTQMMRSSSKTLCGSLAAARQ